jgi:hypothetical protein
MPVSISEVKTKRELAQFIYLPLRLHRGNPQWVPPVYMDEWKLFNPDKNKAFSYCETILILARKNEKVVGRVMGIIHRGYNELKGEKTGRFGWFECTDDQEVAHAMLNYIQDWVTARGMEKLIGPFGFSDKDPQGCLIDGFQYRAVLTTIYHPPYYKKLIENEGFSKETDLVEYLIPVPDSIPEFYQRIYDRAMKNHQVKIKEFKSKKDLKPFIVPVLKLMNETFSEILGSFPLTEQEMIALAKEYLPVLDPEFVKVVVTGEDEIVAFIVGMPDVAEGLQKARGKLLPFGIFHILRAAKRTDQLVLLLGGIRSDFQGKGLDALMGIKMLETATRRKFRVIDSHLELESNYKVRAEMEKMGGKTAKVFRIYQKSLIVSR